MRTPRVGRGRLRPEEMDGGRTVCCIECGMKLMSGLRALAKSVLSCLAGPGDRTASLPDAARFIFNHRALAADLRLIALDSTITSSRQCQASSSQMLSRTLT